MMKPSILVYTLGVVVVCVVAQMSAPPWINVNPEPTGATLAGLAVSSQSGRIVAVGSGNLIMTSDDGGNTWTAQQPLEQGIYSDVAYSYASNSFMVPFGDSVFVSADDGVTWNYTQVTGDACCYMSIATSTDGTRAIASAIFTEDAAGCYILYSEDGGATFNYTRMPDQGCSYCTNVEYSASMDAFVIASCDTVWASPTGLDWSNVSYIDVPQVQAVGLAVSDLLGLIVINVYQSATLYVTQIGMNGAMLPVPTLLTPPLSGPWCVDSVFVVSDQELSSEGEHNVAISSDGWTWEVVNHVTQTHIHAAVFVPDFDSVVFGGWYGGVEVAPAQNLSALWINVTHTFTNQMFVSAQALGSKSPIGGFLAGTQSSVFWFSPPNGLMWSMINVPEEYTSIGMMNAEQGIYVALGDVSAAELNGAVLTSPDGVNWAAWSVPKGYQEWCSVPSYGCTVGHRRVPGDGPRGTTPMHYFRVHDLEGGEFTQSSTSSSQDVGQYFFRGLAFGNGRWVATGISACGCFFAVVSTDTGKTWDMYPQNINIIPEGVLFFKGVFYAYSNNVTVFSPDGVGWSELVGALWNLPVMVAGDYIFNSLANDCSFMASSDAQNWQYMRIDRGCAVAVNYVSYAPAVGYVAVGLLGGVYYSANLTSWETWPVPTYDDFFAVGLSNTTVVVMGASGRILTGDLCGSVSASECQ